MSTSTRRSDNIDFARADLLDLLNYLALSDEDKDMVEYLRASGTADHKYYDLENPYDGVWKTWRGWFTHWAKHAKDPSHGGHATWLNYRKAMGAARAR